VREPPAFKGATKHELLSQFGSATYFFHNSFALLLCLSHHAGHPILGDLTYKHHRKPECQVTAAAGGIQAWLPQLLHTNRQQHGVEQQQEPPQQPLPPAQQQQQAQQPEQQYEGVVSLQQQQQQQQGKLQPPAPPQQQQQGVQLGGAQQIIVPLLDLAVYAGGNAHHQRKSRAAAAAAAAAEAAAAGSSSSAESSATDYETGAARSSNGTASESDVESDIESETAGSGSAKQRGEVLQDGTMVGTCLWAVQLQLQHPDSGAVLDMSMDTSVVQLFERICDLDAPSGHV
jgi:hypothetical protein